MHLMNTIKVCIAISLMQILSSCNQQEDVNEDLVQVQSHLDLAQVYKDQGQFRASVIETQNAAQLMPGNLETRIFIAKLYIELGDINSAINELNNALAATPDNTELKLLLAEAYLLSNQSAAGLTLINSLQVSPDQEVQKNWLLGSLQAASGDAQSANATLLSVYAMDKLHVPTLIVLSKLSYLNGDLQQTNDYIQQASQASSDEDEDLWIWRGQLAMLQEDYPTAELAYFEALDIMSLQDIMTAKRFTTLQSILVPLQMQQKNDEALRYSQIIANSPQGEFNAEYQNAFSLLQQGSIADAEEQLNDLLTTAPDHPGSNILLGIARYSNGDFTQAERLLSEYVNTDTATPQLVLALASTHLKLNQPDKALAVLQSAQLKNPQDASILTMIGVIERGQGKLNESIATLSSVIDMAPQDGLPQFAIAGTYLQQQNYDQAVSHLQEAIKLNPEFVEAKSLLLNTYLAQQDTNSAKQLVDSWLAEDSASSLNNMAAGVLASTSNDFATARTYFEKVLQNDPEDIQAQLYLAKINVQEQNLVGALNIFTSILDKDVSNANALGGLLAVGELAGSAPESVSKIQQIINDNPSEYVPSLVLGQYYLNNADLTNAYTYAEKSVSIMQNDYTINLLADITNNMVNAELQNKDYAKARELLDKLLVQRPEHIQTLGKYVEVEAAAGNFDAAQVLVEKVRQIQPEQVYSYELEGELLRSQNNIEGALAAFRTAWGIQRNSVIGTKIYQILLGQNDGSAAQNFLNEWIASDNNEVAPKVLSAMHYQQENNTAQAIALYEEISTLQPNNLVMLNNLAWLIQDSDPERALELAQRGAELYPNNAEVLDTYGWILFQQDKRDEARVALNKALELAPDSASIKEHVEAVQ
ncbi:MAG: tetratricopeptide repeat protein [Pseudomonadota bacterium]